MTNKAVHKNVLQAPSPKRNKQNSSSRSPRNRKKATGFVDLEKAGKKVVMDDAMKNHVRDDRKPNPKKLEKSMSLQVREYLAQVEERVANVPAKEIGMKYGYDIDNPDNTLQDLINFTGSVSKACE